MASVMHRLKKIDLNNANKYNNFVFFHVENIQNVDGIKIACDDPGKLRGKDRSYFFIKYLGD